MSDDAPKPPALGELAKAAGQSFPLRICRSQAGFYIGTLSDEGEPFTRESVEYWKKREQAEAALRSGGFTQRPDL
jgi:hypothetical protein